MNGEGQFAKLDQSLRDAFKKGYEKYSKYSNKLNNNAIIYTAYILNPCCCGSIIKDIIPDKQKDIFAAVKVYYLENWP